jgi:hypothetical protein
MNYLKMVPIILAALLISAAPNNVFSAEKIQIVCVGSGKAHIPVLNYSKSTGQETNSFSITETAIESAKCEIATERVLLCKTGKIATQGIGPEGTVAISFDYLLDRISGVINTTTTSYYDRNYFANTFPRSRSQIMGYAGEVYKQWTFEGNCTKAKRKF